MSRGEEVVFRIELILLLYTRIRSSFRQLVILKKECFDLPYKWRVLFNIRSWFQGPRSDFTIGGGVGGKAANFPMGRSDWGHALPENFETCMAGKSISSYFP